MVANCVDSQRFGAYRNFTPRCNENPYLQQVVQTLRAEGVEVRDKDLARLSPARYEHINRLSKYTFPRQVEVEPNGLRRLRKPLETD